MVRFKVWFFKVELFLKNVEIAPCSNEKLLFIKGPPTQLSK